MRYGGGVGAMVLVGSDRFWETDGVIRAFAGASLLAGVGWAVISVDSILDGQPRRYRDALFLFPWSLSAAGLVGLHLAQRGTASRVERIGLRAALLAMAVAALGVGGALSANEDLKAVAGPGVALWTVAMVALGAGTMQSGTVPRWTAVALMVSQPLTMAMAAALSPLVPMSPWGSYSGALVHALVWSSLGAVLWRRAPQLAEARADG